MDHKPGRSEEAWSAALQGQVLGKARGSFGGKLRVDSANRSHGEDRQSTHLSQSARLVPFAAGYAEWRGDTSS